MRGYRYLIIACLAAALLVGCGAKEENPYRVDTVVQIPVDPTEPPTEPAEEETEAATEPEATAEETQGKSSSSGKTSGSKKTSSSSGKTSSSGNKNSSSGKKPSTPKATEPKETQPAETEPPATQLPTEMPTEAPTEPPYNPSDYSVGSLEYAVLDAINAYRAEAGIPALSMSTRLSGIAALRTEEIVQLWNNSRPDGRNFTSALSDYGYGYSAAAESLIYATDSDAQAMVDKWMGSDSNRNNLLSAGYTTAGIGVFRSGGMNYVACILVG